MKTTRVCSFCVTLLACCTAATDVAAQFRPAQVRASETAQWSQADCMARAKQTFDLEGYFIDSTGGDFHAARKGPAHAYITCNPSPGGGVVWSVIVASTASDESCLAERDRLVSRLKNTTAGGTASSGQTGGLPGGTTGGTTGGATGTAGVSAGSTEMTSSGIIGARAPYEREGGINVSRGRPARQSSYYFPQARPDESQGAVDGVKNGGFGFHTKSEPNAWWQVDLGTSGPVSEIRIYNRLEEAGRARTIQVLLSNDERDWKLAYAHDGRIFGGVDGRALNIDLKGYSGRFVRLQLAETNALHLDEVEVYRGWFHATDLAIPPGTNPTPTSTPGAGATNLALGRPARQSSYYFQPPQPVESQGAVDGQKGGGFGFHTQPEPNPWWQVDLGVVRPLTEIRVFNRLDCCSERARTLQVLLSDDGVNWTRVFSNDGTVFGGADGKPLVVSVKGRSARFVRLQLAETNVLHLDEVEIY